MRLACIAQVSERGSAVRAMTRKGSAGCAFNAEMARAATVRALNVLALYREHRSLATVADQLGVSRERVRQLVRRGEELERNASAEQTP